MPLPKRIPKRRLSGLQRQVLSLYRNFLRQTRFKVKNHECSLTEEESMIVRNNIRENFESNRNVDAKNFMKIEFLIRSGEKQLKMFKDPSVTGLANIHKNIQNRNNHNN